MSDTYAPTRATTPATKHAKTKAKPVKRKRAAPVRKTVPLTEDKFAASLAKKPNEYAGKFDKNIAKIAKCMTDFTAAVEDFQEMDAGVFADLDTDINARKQAIEYLNARYDEEKRMRCIDIDLKVKQHGVDAAAELVEAQGSVVVNKDMYEAMCENYAKLKASYEDDVRQAVKTASELNVKHTAAMVNANNLTNEAKVAKVEAEYEAQKSLVSRLESQITDLRQDLKDNMKMTESIMKSNAQAAASANQMHMSSFGSTK